MTIGKNLFLSVFRKINPYMGGLFCAFLVYRNLDESGSALKMVLIWLPMCFLFMGSSMQTADTEQRYRIQALETALAELKEKTTE